MPDEKKFQEWKMRLWVCLYLETTPLTQATILHPLVCVCPAKTMQALDFLFVNVSFLLPCKALGQALGYARWRAHYSRPLDSLRRRRKPSEALVVPNVQSIPPMLTYIGA